MFTHFFQLVRHFNGLQSLLATLGQAYKELGLLMCLLFVCVLTFARLQKYLLDLHKQLGFQFDLLCGERLSRQMDISREFLVGPHGPDNCWNWKQNSSEFGWTGDYCP